MMAPVPNHPYVQYEAGPDRFGRWWITCQCCVCGDRYETRCYHPERTSERVFRYASLHSHGLMPVMTR